MLRQTLKLTPLRHVDQSKPTPLPQVDKVEAHSWREGWWQGLPVGVVIGFAAAVIFLKG
jgi:hypothetical protein